MHLFGDTPSGMAEPYKLTVLTVEAKMSALDVSGPCSKAEGG